jgi:KUP system potassium uptake protein
VNTALMLGCLALVVTFGSASALASAYGIAVTGTITITTALFYAIARHRWAWSPLHAGLLAGAFLVIDLAFLGANLVKLDDGGWVAIAFAAAVFLLMTTWKRGTALVGSILAARAMPLADCIEQVTRGRLPRVPGTAVFLTPDVGGAPPVLLHHLRHNKALHQNVIILSVLVEEVPEVPDEERVQAKSLPGGFHQVRASYGFMETPDIQEVVEVCCDLGLAGREEETSYYLGRARLLPTGPSPMMRWRKRLFAVMAHNASSATDFYGLPPQRVVELGARLEF